MAEMGSTDETSETSDASGSEAARRSSLRVGGLRSKHSLHDFLAVGQGEGTESPNLAYKEIVQNQFHSTVLWNGLYVEVNILSRLISLPSLYQTL